MVDVIETAQSPAERRRHKVRQAILEAAERVFAEEGEAGLSIRRLADEIDYSPAAIYKYFASKQELVDELKEAFFEKILDQVRDVPSEDAPFFDYACGYVETYIRTALERPHHYAAAFAGQSEVPTVDLTCDQQGLSNRELAFGMLHQMVEEGVRRGAFRPDLDTFLASKSLWASSHGLVAIIGHLPRFATDFFSGPSHDEDHLIQSHAAFLIKGLMA